MKLSEFRQAVADEFGESYGRVVLGDLVLPGIGCTADDALAAGVPAREVWLALCEATEVPESRRYGVGRLDPKRR
ncbi:DUF3046 domain-containing protein [Agromyces archimandritae]|uniref:DUF3046 domain-containing protein n=1 Tax=Agromyces archimandritae TaxID=2781962 RepID=A0A975FP20_9MICO|nr:DUF3046 domain-containing protein [Agromyces archimandritae]QTX05023.1 DUF3046 domain-containing protein [Agromyces archimandritae]